MNTPPDYNTFCSRRPYTFDRVVRIIISLIFIGIGVWLLYTLRDVLLPFCVAWLIAYLLEPFVQFNRRLFKLKGRFVAILITLSITTIFLVAMGIIFIPSIINEMHQVSSMITSYASSDTEIDYIPSFIHRYLKQVIDLKSLSDSLASQNSDTVFDILSKVVSGGWTIVLGIFNWILVFLYVIFIMLDYDKLIVGFKNLVPPRYRQLTLSIAHDVQTSMNQYFRGQALIAIIVGVMYATAFSIIGIPLGILMGLFVGLLSMIPYMQLVSIIPTTFICLIMSVNGNVSFWIIWWNCILAYAIIQSIEDLYLTPKIMGKAMGLNPAIILLSLSIWGALLGLIGMIIALPMTTLLISYYKRYIIDSPDGGNRQERQRAISSLDSLTGIKF
ncbi:MAG: AI-2E family transporter [Muribaculaceae bacterium]|nr:AI-2E family transporter [Muribaculaceae bacterium]